MFTISFSLAQKRLNWSDFFKKNIYFKNLVQNLGCWRCLMESILDTLLQLVNPRQLHFLPGISGSWACRSFIPRGFQVERPGTLPHKGRGKLLPLDFSVSVCSVEVDLIGERMTGPTFGAILIECRCCKNYWRVPWMASGHWQKHTGFEYWIEMNWI